METRNFSVIRQAQTLIYPHHQIHKLPLWLPIMCLGLNIPILMMVLFYLIGYRRWTS
jgi:hypothetical protein